MPGFDFLVCRVSWIMSGRQILTKNAFNDFLLYFFFWKPCTQPCFEAFPKQHMCFQVVKMWTNGYTLTHWVFRCILLVNWLSQIYCSVLQKYTKSKKYILWKTWKTLSHKNEYVVLKCIWILLKTQKHMLPDRCQNSIQYGEDIISMI